MPQGTYFADIHMHPTMKTFNSFRGKKLEPTRNLWDHYDHDLGKTNPAKFIIKNTTDLAKYSQTNFHKLLEGKVRVITASLYPTEKGFMNMRILTKAITHQGARNEMLQAITGFTMDSIRYLKKHNGYFEELEGEYQYLHQNQGKAPNGKGEYKLVNNYSELTQLLQKKNTIGVVVSVEGCHSLFNAKMMSGKLSKAEMKKELTRNIEKIKSWEVPPFNMNLSHHFYNELCGHAKSFFGPLGTFLLQQKKGLETGLTGLGIKALKELLSNNNGKRILIDSKHMSLKGRKEFYNWVRSYNYLSNVDKIPLICSHTGVNGYKTMSGSLQKPDNVAKIQNSYLNRLSINISDEEINIIKESDGLIGIMFEKNKLGGGKFFDSIKKETDKEKITEAYSKIFLDNCLQIVQAVGNKSGWDHICIGSDLDGAIQHFDDYDTAAQFPKVYENLVRYLDKHQYEKQLWYGYKPEEIVDKIMRKNVMDFYSKYFV